MRFVAESRRIVGLLEARGEVACLDDGAAYARHVLAERACVKCAPGWSFNSRRLGERRAVEALNLYVERFERGGRAGRTSKTTVARVRVASRLRVVRDLGAVEAAVAQVCLDGVGVLAQRKLAQALARLKQRDARAQLVLAHVGAGRPWRW
jgi:hypothetical protein